MEIPIYTVDAFTNVPFKGNPAAVCLLENELKEELYLNIAAEMNLSETAFITKLQPTDFCSGARFGLRWFTPKNEITLCGHATLASAAVLFYKKGNTNPVLAFETLSGELLVHQRGDSLVMDFPLNKPEVQDRNKFNDILKAAVGDLPIQEVCYCKTTKKLLVRLLDTCDRSVLTSLNPVTDALLKSEDSGRIKSLVITVKGAPSSQPGYDFYSRNFAPWVGVPEDPVTAYQCSRRGGKGRELADMMERRKVDILCVQETRWKGSKARSIGAGFKLFYYGVDSKRNGVGVVLKEEFVRNVLEVKRVSDRVMSLKLEIEGVMLNVVSGYAPQVGCELEEKERFWSELDEVMESIPTGERVVIGADFNGHVGEGNTGDEEVMGKFGVKERNLEGQMVVDFAKRMDMGVVNTYFQKREEHRVTYKSGGRRTQKKRSKIEKKTKWWKVKKEECCEEFRQKLRQALGGQVVLPDDWETTAEVIRETGRKVLGVSSGRRKEDKETWWWNEEVQDSIQRKRLAKKKWDMDRTEENRQEYKEL
ncbi:hypothetical protein QTP86_007415 [Hemibagrus guttatus]|nr:hypothetical protein QTP86_007415 [Hemibagrus guttatus]